MPHPQPDDLELLRVAVERRYLKPFQAEHLLTTAAQGGRPLEELILAEGLLSRRRLQRLHSHMRYRAMRRADKAYAQVACREGVLSEAQARAALTEQRRRFEATRERVRLGSLLIDQGLLTVERDRELRLLTLRAPEDSAAAVSQLSVPASDVARAGPSSCEEETGSVALEPAAAAFDPELCAAPPRGLRDSAIALEEACQARARLRVAALRAGRAAHVA